MSPFVWGEFLSLARRLVGDGSLDRSEAGLRTAISRAYYATFHAASAFVRANRLVPDAERLTHDKVWAILTSDEDRARADVGQRGNALRRQRVNADYRNPFPDADISARTTATLTEATNLIDAIDRLT